MNPKWSRRKKSRIRYQKKKEGKPLAPQKKKSARFGLIEKEKRWRTSWLPKKGKRRGTQSEKGSRYGDGKGRSPDSEYARNDASGKKERG